MSGNVTCEWHDDGGCYTATCDPSTSFHFDDDGPLENGFKFCPYCGRPLVCDGEQAVASNPTQVQATLQPEAVPA
jgi:hypothetical protein